MNKRTVLILSLTMTAVYLLWLLCTTLFFMPEEGWRVAERTVSQSLLLEGRNTRRALLPGEQVDLNEASTDSLQRLPGIGPVLADAIVAWREENGPFEKPEDLMRVPGIGKAKYAAVQDMITVEGTK